MYTNNEKFEIYQTEINFKNNKTSVLSFIDFNLKIKISTRL